MPAPLPSPEPASRLDLDPDVAVEQIEVHLRRAAPWRRLASWAVDGLVLGAIASPLLALVIGAAGPPGGYRLRADLDGLVEAATRLGRLLVPTLVFLALAAGVYSALGTALMGATPGKRLLGLRVVAGDGRPPSPGRAAARSALALLSLSLAGLGCLLALFARSGRALHDFLAGTYVVER